MKGALKVELQMVARRLGAMTAYELSWSEWDEVTHTYTSDAECRAVVASLLGEWFSEDRQLRDTQVIFDEPHELVVKGPAGICTWASIDDMVAEAVHLATGADKVFVVEGEAPWDDLLPRGHSADFDTIF